MAKSDKELADAFRDLEDMICKVRDMAGVTSTLIESHLHNPETKGAYKLFHIDDASVGEMFFAVYDVEARAKALAAKYYSGFESPAR